MSPSHSLLWILHAWFLWNWCLIWIWRARAPLRPLSFERMCVCVCCFPRIFIIPSLLLLLFPCLQQNCLLAITHTYIVVHTYQTPSWETSLFFFFLKRFFTAGGCELNLHARTPTSPWREIHPSKPPTTLCSCPFFLCFSGVAATWGLPKCFYRLL